MDWVGGTLSNTLQLANNKDDGLDMDVRVEKNIYGLCGRAYKLCDQKEQWKVDLKNAVREDGERALRHEIYYLTDSLVPAVCYWVEDQNWGSNEHKKLVKARREKTELSNAHKRVLEDTLKEASGNDRQDLLLLTNHWSRMDIRRTFLHFQDEILEKLVECLNLLWALVRQLAPRTVSDKVALKYTLENAWKLGGLSGLNQSFDARRRDQTANIKTPGSTGDQRGAQWSKESSEAPGAVKRRAEAPDREQVELRKLRKQVQVAHADAEDKLLLENLAAKGDNPPPTINKGTSRCHKCSSRYHLLIKGLP
eukprot:Pgem_evm2s1594